MIVKNRKKILIIGMTPNRGGTETFSMNLFNALRKKYKSVDITFLNIWKEDIAYKNEIIENGGHILNYQMPTGIKNMVFGYHIAKKLFSVYKFDAVHINANYLLPSFFAIAAKNSGITKVIFHAHNTSYGNRNFLKKSILKSIAILQRKKLNNKNIQLLAASTEAGNWMFRQLDFTVITNGIEVEKFNFDRDVRNEVRMNLNIPEDSKVIISVARIEYQKNHEKIISIFNELYYKKKYYLILVGSGSLQNDIIQKIYNLGISDRVKFLGSQKDVKGLLMASDLMIMPSLYEGLPFSAVEAQAAGLPLVVSKEAFTSEVNIINKISYLSNSESDKEWAKNINDMIVDNSFSDRNVDNDIVGQSKFGFDKIVSEILSFY